MYEPFSTPLGISSELAPRKIPKQLELIMSTEPEIPDFDFNIIYAGLYREADFHLTPSNFDQDIMGNVNVEPRMRYYFNYLGSTEGNDFFASRIHSNMIVLKAMHQNMQNRIRAGEQQVAYMNALPTSSKDTAANYIGIMRKRVAQNVRILSRDRYWEVVLDLEVQMSQSFKGGRMQPLIKSDQLSLGRTAVARQAGALSRDMVYPGVHNSFNVFYTRFAQLRDEALSIMRRVLSLLEHGPVQGDTGEALRGFHERHRNEIWDIWGDGALDRV